MKAYELANKLLSMPNVEVFVEDSEEGCCVIYDVELCSCGSEIVIKSSNYSV